jgi:hypothetical protein
MPICLPRQPVSFEFGWQQMTSMPERRRYPRFNAWLPLRLTAVAGKIESATVTLLTQNISKAGVCFRAPRWVEPGQAIEVEVTLVGFGPGGKDIHISGIGSIVRIDPGEIPGWYKLAAAFDELPADDERGWHKLAAEFDQRSPS